MVRRIWLTGVLLTFWRIAAAEPVAVEVLADFGEEDPLEGWSLQQVEGEPAGEGMVRLRYPAWEWWRGKWPSAILDLGSGEFDEEDWTRYDRLVFEVRNESASPAQLKLRLDDREGKRAVRIFHISAEQEQVCVVPIAELDRGFDVGGVVHFDLYMSQPAVDYAFLLDEIRLEADSLEIETAELRIDPFEEGRIGVRARGGRSARWRVRVVGQDGGTAGLHEEGGNRLEWEWAGGETGQYEVELSVADTVWSGEETVRRLGNFAVIPEGERAEWVVWVEPTTRKVMLHDRPRAGQVFFTGEELEAEDVPPLRVEMARNEWEGAQAVFLTRRDSAVFRFVLEELRHSESGEPLFLEESAVHQVGYVFTREPGMYAVEFSGWWPDPLLPAAEMRAVPGECMPVWVALKTGEGAAPGTYRGGLGIWADGMWAGRLPLEVRVYDAIVPDSSAVRTAFSLYDHMLEKVYGEVAPLLYRKYQHFIADHRLNIDHLYRSALPSIADLRYFARRGQLNAFNLLYMRAGEDYGHDRLEEIAGILDPYVEELRRLGLVDRAYIYGFDEVSGDQFDELKRVFGFFKERYPDVRTATTARDPGLGKASGLGEVVDIWVPLTAVYDPETAAGARQRGDEVWWYICIAPTHPFANWFVEYPAMEARLLWWMAYRRRVSGFLYYTMNRWPRSEAPMRIDGNNKTDWDPASYETANGDGCLFYPGPEGPISTVRLENVRDGLEDYELLRLLGGEGADFLCDRLIGSLTDYSRDVEAFAGARRELLEKLEAETAK